MKNRLQDLRWKKGWSEEQLSRESGVSRSTICYLENNENVNPKVESAFKLAQALEVSVEEIFYW